MVHINSGILLSSKKEYFESVLMSWMNLEFITQNEMSESERQIFYISSYI